MPNWATTPTAWAVTGGQVLLSDWSTRQNSSDIGAAQTLFPGWKMKLHALFIKYQGFRSYDPALILSAILDQFCLLIRSKDLTTQFCINISAQKDAPLAPINIYRVNNSSLIYSVNEGPQAQNIAPFNSLHSVEFWLSFCPHIHPVVLFTTLRYPNFRKFR